VFDRARERRGTTKLDHAKGNEADSDAECQPPGPTDIGFQHGKGSLIIARKADRYMMLLRAKDPTPIVNELYESPDGDRDAILSVALGDWQSELRSGRVLSCDGQRFACYA
jgi:hypothetical protein